MPEQNHHSSRVSALLGKPPGWLISWGTVVVFSVLAILLVLAAFVRYPEVITAQAIISGTHPPQVIAAQRSGRFAQFFVGDGERVQSGEVLAVLENDAQYADVRHLDSLLSLFESFIIHPDTPYAQMSWPNMQLGEVQPFYQQFTLAYTNLSQFYAQDAYSVRIAALERQLINFRLYYKRSWQQRVTLQEQYDLALQRYQTDSMLTADGVYAVQELSKRKEQLLQLRYSLHGARAALAQTQMQMADLEQNLASLKLEYARERENRHLALRNAESALQSAIQAWKNSFAFVARISGEVNYQTLWAPGQNVPQGGHVFTVLPQEKNVLKARMLVPPVRFSNVNIGQRVQLKLDAYPFEQYGMIVGNVSKRNTAPIQLPDGSYAYVVEVDFAEGLETTYGQSVTDIDELTGTGEIITEELSLLVRIFYKLRKIFD
jgi:multidrug resistance efflux pump